MTTQTVTNPTRSNIRASKYTGQQGEILWVPPHNLSAFNPRRIGVSDIDLEATGTVQAYPVGTALDDAWGRRFRYVKFGGTVAQNDLVAAEAPAGDWDEVDIVAAVAGDTTVVTTTSHTVAVNEWAGGWLGSEALVSGMLYPIIGNAVASAAVVTIYLGQPIRTAIAAGADLTVLKSPYMDVVQAPITTIAAQPVGVCVGSGAVDDDFGWLQTRGPGKVLAAASLVAGNTAVALLSAAGNVGPASDATKVTVGSVMNVGASGEWAFVYLMLE